ncbi:hypothetical protein [Phaeacidiphilus oryzae]|uniref:hypothetical protein n=1 Tax=Phaeacidiphilus oryzae TaxID=348818 RepID=UPI001F3AD15D|nr:hypothetical protein [Phaeacidiphilus oryzae]
MGPFRKQDEQGKRREKRPVGTTGGEDGQGGPAGATGDELARLVTTDPDTLEHDARERGRRLASLASALRRGTVDGVARGGRAAGRGAMISVQALADRLLDAAPRIPVRDLATLRAQHPRAETPEELADKIVSGAARSSAAVGAGVGSAAMLPTPPAMPVEIAADVFGAAAVEFKMIAELYAVYGQPATGNATQRAGAYLAVWTERRGIDITKPAGLAALSTGGELRRQLRRRLTRSSMRKLPSLAPLLMGAVVGAELNRRDTFKLAQEVRRELRRREPTERGYWAAALEARPADRDR